MPSWRRYLTTLHAFAEGDADSVCGTVKRGLTVDRTAPNKCRGCRVRVARLGGANIKTSGNKVVRG